MSLNEYFREVLRVLSDIRAVELHSGQCPSSENQKTLEQTATLLFYSGACAGDQSRGFANIQQTWTLLSPRLKELSLLEHFETDEQLRNELRRFVGAGTNTNAK